MRWLHVCSVIGWLILAAWLVLVITGTFEPKL